MNKLTDQQSPPRVAIIGGGLAGLAAAVAAVEKGLEVELFEARRRLGGRAGSFRDARSGELVDHCQHVSMGCCTQLADFCRRTGVGECFHRYKRLTFIGPTLGNTPWPPSDGSSAAAFVARLDAARLSEPGGTIPDCTDDAQL